MVLRDYAADVVTKLAAAGISLTAGTNLFHGKMRAADVAGFPDKAVSVLTLGGPAPQDYCQGGTHTPQMYQPTVQIMIRSNVRDFSGGETLARTVYGAIHDASITGYHGCRAQTGSPIYVGETNEGHHLWSLAITLMICE